MNKTCARLFLQLKTALIGIVVVKAMQNNVSSIPLGSHDFDKRSRLRHDNCAGYLILGCRNCNPLRMITRRGCYYAAASLLFAQAREFITCPSHLEGARTLHILGFQIDLSTGDIIQGTRWCEWGMMKMRLEELVGLPDVGDGEYLRLPLPANNMQRLGSFMSSVIFNETHDVVCFLSAPH